MHCCLKCRKNTESKIPKVAKTKYDKIMLLSTYVVCNSKKSKFAKEQKGSGLFLEIKTPISKIPLVSPLLY